MPLRFQRGGHGRVALTVIAIACGVALVCAIDLCNRAVMRAFMEVIDAMGGRASLQVVAGEGGLFPEEVAAKIAAVSGVELAVPVVSATAFTAEGTGELLTVHGVEVTSEAAVRVYEAQDNGGLGIDDPLMFLSQLDSVVLTRTFAERRGLAVGSRIAIETPIGRRWFVVRGLLEPQGIARAYGGNLMVMDLAAAQAAFTSPGLINRIDVVVGRDQRRAEVVEAIAAALPAGLKVETPSQRKADLGQVMRSLRAMLEAMGLVALVAAFLIAFSRLATVFEARAWQLGVLRAAGVRGRSVWWGLLRESLFVGAAGVTIGIPLGVGLGWLLLPVIARTTALNYKLVAPEVGLALHASSLALAAGLGMAAALLAGAVPGWRAARVPVIETIRSRGVDQRGVAAPVLWLSRVVAAGGIGAAIAMQSITRSPLWGLVATAFLAVGTVLAARPMLSLLRVSLFAAVLREGGPTVRFAIAVLGRNMRRATLTAAMLGVGLGSILWLRMLAHSFEQSLVGGLTRALGGDLVVTSSHVVSGYVEAPVDQALRRQLEGVTGVDDVAGERLADWQYAGGPIAIEAFDAGYFDEGGFGRWPLLAAASPDAWKAVARGEATIVSANFVQNLHARVGDTVTIETPSGPLGLPVAGVTPNFSSPRGTIFMSRELYARFWRDTQVNRFFVRTAPGVDANTVRSAIARALGKSHGLRILSVNELIEYFATQVRRAFAPIDALAVLVLVVILVGVADTLAAGIVERTRELGVMRAVGIRRGHLGRMVVVEGLLVGAVGLLLAASAGLALGTLWVRATFPYLLGWVLETHIPYQGGANIVLATTAACVIAALLPARRATALEPAVALQYE